MTNFIHIPKTGGSSILKLIGDNPNVTYCGHHFAPSPAFAVTRHPYDRLISAYVYLMNGGGQNEMDLEYQALLMQYTDFADFVFHLESDSLTDRIVHLKPMHTFVCEDGKIAVDNLFRIEKPEQIDAFLESLGLGKLSEVRVNATRWHYSNYLSFITTGEINRVYHDDFKLFKYRTVA